MPKCKHIRISPAKCLHVKYEVNCWVFMNFFHVAEQKSFVWKFKKFEGCFTQKEARTVEKSELIYHASPYVTAYL